MAVQSAASPSCPAQKLSTLHRIDEKGVELQIDHSTKERPITMEIPINLAIGRDTISLFGQSIKTTARLPIRKRLWRFTTRATGLSSDYLNIHYEFDSGNQLQSTIDPSSKIGVSIVNRKIDTRKKRKHTRFDAYVDLIVDYSAARIAGPYQGLVTITIDCKLP